VAALRLAAQGTESFPKSLDVIKTCTRMLEAFPGTVLPATVVVEVAAAAVS
jgi:hypothetical protein